MPIVGLQPLGHGFVRTLIAAGEVHDGIVAPAAMGSGTSGAFVAGAPTVVVNRVASAGALTVAPTVLAANRVTPAPASAAASATVSAVTPDTTAPVISGVAVTATGTSITLSWTTSEPATRRVEYGPTTAYGTLTTMSAVDGTVHAVTFPATANTTYHLRALSQDATGNAAVGDDWVVVTPKTLASVLGAKLVADYDAAAETAYASGATVTSPTDQDGNAYGLSQPTAGERPVWVDDLVGPAYRFASTGEWWSATIAATTALGFTSSFAIGVVLDTADASAMGVVYRIETDTTDGWELAIGQGGNTGKVSLVVSGASAGTWRQSTVRVDDDLPHLILANVDTTGPTATLHIDDAAHDVVSVSVPTSAASNNLGVGRFHGGTGPLVGNIRRLFLVNGLLTAAELDEVKALLAGAA